MIDDDDWRMLGQQIICTYTSLTNAFASFCSQHCKLPIPLAMCDNHTLAIAHLYEYEKHDLQGNLFSASFCDNCFAAIAQTNRIAYG